MASYAMKIEMLWWIIQWRCFCIEFNTTDIWKQGCSVLEELARAWLAKTTRTRVLWNTYPVRCCCMKLCETQLIAEEDYKFARTHTFALLTMVIALCTIKHLWIWTCWTNCTVFFVSILVDFFHFKFVLLDNFCSCCYYNYIASLTSYWTKLYRKLAAACSLYHTGVVLEQKYSIKLICQYGYVSSCKASLQLMH